MTDEQAYKLGEWLRNNQNRPLGYMEKEFLKGLVDQSNTIGQLIENLAGLAGMIR
ncbi:MAG: hypothetical protein K6F49_04785 [Saccharofermentans sp.]|jgi:hypothetical protein|nr:hypothetical protein [Saccharofermentans sp.]